MGPGVLPPGTDGLFFYNYSKRNESTKWISDKFIHSEEHIVKFTRGKRVPHMHIFYDDLNIIPTGKLTEDNMMIDIEDA